MMAKGEKAHRAKQALSKLKRKLGPAVSSHKDDLYRVSFDGMKVSFMPDALIRVAAPEQVGVVLSLANQYKIPVTTRGAGSSLTSSAAPMKGGWVLDVSKLNKIKIDKLSGMAHVQAGAVVADIQKAAEQVGWFYPPDPSSNKYCTIGGNIACNAGGLRGAKYGVTRDYVLSLEGFLPTGEAVSFARPLRKWAVGYNMRDLWIGSEGTLGVVTQACLRLVPAPETRATFLFAFPNEASGIKAIRALMAERLVPVALEFLDSNCIKGLEAATGKTVFKGYPGSSIVLIELDGSAYEVKRQRASVKEWGKAHASASKEAKTDAEAQALWDVRRGSSSAMFAFGDSKLNEDIVIPLRQQLPLMRFIKKLRKESGLHILVFGHAADGNFHVNIMYYRGEADQCERAEKAVQTLMEKVVELGGSISGEHGIGLAKTSFVPLQLGEAELKAMLQIKKALDPKGILNPGKLFEPYPAWQRTPEKVALPWDHKRLASQHSK